VLTLQDLRHLLVSFQVPLFTASDLDQRARSLRTAGLIPNPGRGGASPPARPEHVAAILIGVAAPAAAGAAGHVREIGALVPTAGEAPFSADDFAQALAAPIAAPERAAEIYAVRIGTDAAFAFISLAPETAGEAPRVVTFGEPPAARRSVLISGPLLLRLAEGYSIKAVD